MLRRLRSVLATCFVVGAAVPVALTLTAAPAGAVEVTTEAELDAAFADGSVTEIVITGPIALTCAVGQLERNEDTNPIIVRNSVGGFATDLTQTCAGERIALQDGTASVEFDTIRLTGGEATDGGGAIKSSGDVILTNSVLADNVAIDSSGGAVQSEGTITVTGSGLRDNQATGGGSGGALDAEDGVSVTNSNLSVNDAGDTGGAIRSFGPVALNSTLIAGNSTEGDTGGGGGIDAGQGDLVTLVNSTVTNNSAGANIGGGIRSADLHLVYSDVVGNTGSAGANIAWETELQSFASVIAQPVGGLNCFSPDGTTTSFGYNFSDDSTCGLAAATDRQDAGDPMLGAIITAPPGTICIDYGCSTGGLPLLAGSPLLDAIPPAQCQDDGAAGITTDTFNTFRDARPQGGGCDIGAVEMPGGGTPPPAPPIETPPRFTG